MIRTLNHYWKHPLIYWPSVIITAAATPLTFAPYYWFWLMPLLFAILIHLTELRPERSFQTAYLFGLVGYTAQFYWIHTALHDISGLSDLFALPLTLLFPAYLALYPAACFWLLKKFHLPRSLKIGLALPVLWTLTEFARERFLTGFGWGALGYSQITKDSPLAGFAPLGGIHLVTFATALIGAWLLLMFARSKSPQRRLIPLCLSLLLCIVGYTAQNTEFTRPDGSTRTVALIQGNIEQTLKWDSDQTFPTIQKYYEHIGRTTADLVILPETAIPAMRQNLPENVLTNLADQSQKNGSALAVGIAQYTPDGNHYENVVINLSNYNNSASNEIPYYAKNHLVPFGEYKPLPFITEPLYRMMNMPLSDMKKGGEGQAPLQMKDQKVAFNICYEDGFGDDLIATAKQSTLLANSSNMAWYGDSNAMYQQQQQSQARAMELGRYMVRATNTGATSIISPQGSIVAQAEPNTETVLEGHIKGYTGETPYMKMGSSWPLIGVLTALAALLFLLGRFALHLTKTQTAAPAAEDETEATEN
ncbi:apolipoprotein N-acyltransferase [Neisseria lisongii]|uniref:Apolipoprotein N-acyltransferase n=1 Tax=Neisseria lisongii TaxID=2912188 RepID=A0AAW5AQU3_9NEIS|nr:apolipoprotein N-acyltransferase [Neisseria lisongii]MCF7529778.1 apolipoprotein N-acyltransferase [Neisseria lisongii]